MSSDFDFDIKKFNNNFNQKILEKYTSNKKENIPIKKKNKLKIFLNIFALLLIFIICYTMIIRKNI